MNQSGIGISTLEATSSGSNTVEKDLVQSPLHFGFMSDLAVVDTMRGEGTNAVKKAEQFVATVNQSCNEVSKTGTSILRLRQGRCGISKYDSCTKRG